MQIQISWLLQKPTDLDLHCLQRQDISGFSRTRVNTFVTANEVGRFHWTMAEGRENLKESTLALGLTPNIWFITQQFTARALLCLCWGFTAQSTLRSCWMRSVYLTTLLLGRLKSSKQITSIVHTFTRAFLLLKFPSADSRSAVVSFWRKNVHNTG